MTPSAWAAVACVAVLLAAWRLSLWWERRRAARDRERREWRARGEAIVEMLQRIVAEQRADIEATFGPDAPAERRSGPVAGEGAENGQTSRADEDAVSKSL